MRSGKRAAVVEVENANAKDISVVRRVTIPQNRRDGKKKTGHDDKN
jgi:hypothetical protein